MKRVAWTRDVLESLQSRPWRLTLAGCSLAAGSAALSLLLAVNGGLQARTRAMVAELGVNVFGLAQVQAEHGTERMPHRLSQRHVDSLRAALPDAEVTGLQVYGTREAGLPDGTVLIAADTSLCRVRPWRLVGGRLPDKADEQARARYSLVSVTLARELGVRPGDGLRLRGQPYPILGIIDVTGSSHASSGDALRPGERVAVLPLGVPPYWMAGEAAQRTGLDAVFVRTPDAGALEAALARTLNLLSQPDLRVDPVTWITPESLARRWGRYQAAVSAAGGGVVLLCLLMGGITLMSLLLTDVRERIPEIGLRRSLGASRQQISGLFMAEAFVITTLAALAGVAAAGLSLAVAGSRLPAPWDWHTACVIIPLGAGVVLGMVFSYLPARRAAGIEPAEALRNE